MRTLALLLAVSVAAFGLALPVASATPCIAGDDPDGCAVGVRWVVCVTEPCDDFRACVGYGLLCVEELP